MMETIKAFTAEDAMVIVGTVIDDTMDDALRVTMIATGLGGARGRTKRAPELRVYETAVVERTGTDGVGVPMETINYDQLDQPAVMRKGRVATPAVRRSSFDTTEIPAFLRKQAD